MGGGERESSKQCYHSTNSMPRKVVFCTKKSFAEQHKAFVWDKLQEARTDADLNFQSKHLKGHWDPRLTRF